MELRRYQLSYTPSWFGSGPAHQI